MSNKILHVCNLDKFIPPFIDFIEENFDLGMHFFWLNYDHKRYPVMQTSNVYKVKEGKRNKVRGYLALFNRMLHAEKIILHGLFNNKIILFLWVMPWLLKKCYWVVWGGDLYSYQLSKRDFKWYSREFFRRPVIRNMGHLVTYIPGDVELAREWYGAQGEYCECLMYLSNIVSPEVLKVTAQSNNNEGQLNVLVGNSADPSNNHIEALEKLLPYREQNIKIYVPLSYGDKIYAQKIIDKGNEWFGDKFYPITYFMDFNKYLELLKCIDIAIFNHKRQQGMGNIITLLGLGKKVYMRSDITPWAFFKEKDIKVYDVADINLLELQVNQKNQFLVNSYFSYENCRNQLLDLFY